LHLGVATGAGALLASGEGILPPLLAGSTFAGGFLVAAIADQGLRRRRPLVLGLALACLAPFAARLAGALPDFLWVLPLALMSGGVTLFLARRHSVLSNSVVLFGVSTLGLAAPTSALAGGADVQRALGLYLLLTPVLVVRALLLAIRLRGTTRWEPELLRAWGRREAAIAGAWGLACVFLLPGG